MCQLRTHSEFYSTKTLRTLLFDPGEDNIYEIGHPGLDLLKTRGGHFTRNLNPYPNPIRKIRTEVAKYPNGLQNVFTRERINLPECPWLTIQNSSSCLWINDEGLCCSLQFQTRLLVLMQKRRRYVVVS
ncbi:hypothetical protein YC2023_115225 [Brassica napus]